VLKHVWKKLGLKPTVAHWIYTAVVRPIVTYATKLWWPSIKLKTSISELRKLQRLACLGIAEAIRTNLIAPIEVFLGLPPLQ
jgi:hypothetical protein